VPRHSRIVIPSTAHHVTQRGGRRQNVFFQKSDHETYLELLAKNAHKYGVEIIGYCLMSNHVHHLVAPHRQDSLRKTMQMTHKRYADYINAREGWTGHLWQERFYSCPVDEDYVWATLRYIERNPVAAKMVSDATHYPWSSAAAHCALREDRILTSDSRWSEIVKSGTVWQTWLSEPDDPALTGKLRTCIERELPCGSERFLDDLQARLGRRVRPAKIGRPKVEKS
jgi:putative transposase